MATATGNGGLVAGCWLLGWFVSLDDYNGLDSCLRRNDVRQVTLRGNDPVMRQGVAGWVVRLGLDKII